MRGHIVIAIDGPSGAGKTTAAKSLAAALGVHMLDTGALFRAFGWFILRLGIAPSDAEAVNQALEGVRLDIDIGEGVQRTFVNGEDVSEKIRTPEVSSAASALGANPHVRKVLTREVRRIAKGKSLVVDGRDIGTAMLPDADVKFFLTATPRARATRRFQEQQHMGVQQGFDAVLDEIVARDEADSKREIAPLRCAADAHVIDSTDIDQQQVHDAMLRIIGEKMQ